MPDISPYTEIHLTAHPSVLRSVFGYFYKVENIWETIPDTSSNHWCEFIQKNLQTQYGYKDIINVASFDIDFEWQVFSETSERVSAFFESSKGGVEKFAFQLACIKTGAGEHVFQNVRVKQVAWGENHFGFIKEWENNVLIDNHTMLKYYSRVSDVEPYSVEYWENEITNSRYYMDCGVVLQTAEAYSVLAESTCAGRKYLLAQPDVSFDDVMTALSHDKRVSAEILQWLKSDDVSQEQLVLLCDKLGFTVAPGTPKTWVIDFLVSMAKPAENV